MSPLDKIWFWSRNQRVISAWISLKRLGTGAGSKAEGGLRFHPWSWAFGAHRPGRMTKLDGLKPLDVAAFNPDLKPLDVAAFNPDLNPFVLRWTCIIHITGQGGQSGPQIDKASQQVPSIVGSAQGGQGSGLSGTWSVPCDHGSWAGVGPDVLDVGVRWGPHSTGKKREQHSFGAFKRIVVQCLRWAFSAKHFRTALPASLPRAARLEITWERWDSGHFGKCVDWDRGILRGRCTPPY